MVEFFDDGIEEGRIPVGKVGVALAVILDKSQVFLNELVAEPCGEACLSHIQPFALTHEDLFEVGGVTQDSLRTMVGFPANGLHVFAIKKEFFEDDFFMG